MSDKPLKKRFTDMLERSQKNGSFSFTDFLSAADAAEVYEIAQDNEVSLFGGAEGTERVMIRFGNPEELGYEVLFPIDIIKVAPLQAKFSDKLTHRDYLGALMNLGIERDTIGDIVIKEDAAYIFCVEKMTEFILDNLNRIKHTTVVCTRMEGIVEDVQPTLSERTVVISSLRLDSILSKLYNLSRSDSKALFAEKHVLVNGRLCMNAAYAPKEGDAISSRGFGKCIFSAISHETKKGRIAVNVQVYV